MAFSLFLSTWLSRCGSVAISTVTRLVLHRGREVKTTGTGRVTQPHATDSLMPSRTLEPENLILQVMSSPLFGRAVDLSFEEGKKEGRMGVGIEVGGERERERERLRL